MIKINFALVVTSHGVDDNRIIVKHIKVVCEIIKIVNINPAQ